MKPGIRLMATATTRLLREENPVHVHDLQATIMHLLGFDHTKLTTASRAATTA